jgi:hypothetical protein
MRSKISSNIYQEPVEQVKKAVSQLARRRKSAGQQRTGALAKRLTTQKTQRINTSINVTEQESRAFISYSLHDAETAVAVAALCTKNGLKVWDDPLKTRIYENWTEKTEDAIRGSDTFFILVSNAARSNNEWLSREWSAICERQWSDSDVRVFPILLDDSELPAFLSDQEPIRSHDTDKLVQVIRDRLVKGSKTSGVVVERITFANDESRKKVELRFQELSKVLTEFGGSSEFLKGKEMI